MEELATFETKNYILALVIRSDDERLLLGDGAFEFKESQLHFLADTYANDVVELQGADGQLLAGQVIRSNKQDFDGYIGDASLSKPQIEEYRLQFLRFFRKNFFYKVVYIFADGTAIQRKRGYIEDAPAVPELWQRFPEWHVALNFEDPNYYEYAENEEGEETYAHTAILNLSNVTSGGLVWDNVGAVANPIPQSATSNIFDYDLPTQNIKPANNYDFEWVESDTPAVIQFFRTEGHDNVWWGTDGEIPEGAQANLGFFIGDTFGGWTGVNHMGSFSLDGVTKFVVWVTKEPGKEFPDFRVVLGDGEMPDAPEYEEFSDPRTVDGFVWDAGGSGGPTTVTVIGVDDARPVWKVEGQAINPTVTNITTGQSLTWNGTVPAGQTLIVDMNEMTATLEGANVFEFISGSWITLKPGNNTVAYTADNDAPASTLSWNGVVG